MGYLSGAPNGKLYLGNVKWSNDYSNVLLFPTRIVRNKFFTDNFTLIKEDIIYINPNKYVDIRKKIKDVETLNYLFYSNDDDISDTNYCCFITGYDYIAPRTTRLYLEIDVFQMYHYTTTYYQSFIDRAHILKSSDVYGAWNTNTAFTTPEPIGFGADVENEVLLTDSQHPHLFRTEDFVPRMFLKTLSYPWTDLAHPIYTITDPSTGTQTPSVAPITWTYGGRGSDGNLLGYFLIDIHNLSNNSRSQLIQYYGYDNYWWVNGETFRDHIDILASSHNHYGDLLSFVYLPNWIIDDTGMTIIPSGNDYPILFNGTSLKLIKDNRYVTLNSNAMPINKNTLGNGYSPRNKKLLTSLARAYKIYNQNGLAIPIKPELLTEDYIQCTLLSRPASETFKLIINNYDTFNKFFNLPYHFENSIGYNSNVGVAQQTNAEILERQKVALHTSQTANWINLGMGYAGRTIGTAGSMAGGGTSEAISGTMNFIEDTMGTMTSAMTMLANNRVSEASMSASLNSAYSSIGASFGYDNDKINMHSQYTVIKLAECNPLVEQCKIMDNFFDMFGYAIQKHANPSSYFSTRSNWNYIKTDNINLRCEAPASYENKLKSIFNGGVTIWHSDSNGSDSLYGNYSNSNI